ncbi:unnamed protein product [Candida verbasci]|uniref:Chromatin modification-related protein n=1 Tax=Candida verbasci TaxID=1227364 RepID=A0A9W4U073_9ASCO|nr:unnamed protein product [Candida verbasci]
MTFTDLPIREKSQRLINRQKKQEQEQEVLEGATTTLKKKSIIQSIKSKPKQINNLHELLPGLNDISDAFEALPLDLIKYFTLLKEIDAKCINTIPQINSKIKTYINQLHDGETRKEEDEFDQLSTIKNKINEIIPCLEEKMHVTSVASDLLSKHMYRINQNYKLIVMNNEIPESIRIGPLNHPAMINENVSSGKDTASATNNNRGESRREVLSRKKVQNEDDEDPPTEKDKGTNKKRKLTTPENNTSNKKDKKKNGEENKNYNKKKKEIESKSSANTEPTYCYCNQVSFGEMVACDGENCAIEWFHLPCIGYKNPPKGKWFCDNCKKFK